jgi:spectrin beta
LEGILTRIFPVRLVEVSSLGQQLLSRNPALGEVRERLTWLDTEYAAVRRGYDQKGDWLRQCLDLQQFNKEADHIDTTTSSHEAFLEFTDLGVSCGKLCSLLLGSLLEILDKVKCKGVLNEYF